MASARSEETILTQVLECSVCFKTFQEPKLLPCGHTFCVACLQSYIKGNVCRPGIGEVFFPCPVCRIPTVNTAVYINVETWSRTFPVNRVVSSILDVTRKELKQICPTCSSRGKKISAYFFCKDCEKGMCPSCKELHDSLQTMTQHDVIHLGDHSTIPRLSVVEKCLKHETRDIEYLCYDHGSLCCATCIMKEHKTCKNTLDTSDWLQLFDKKEVVKAMKENQNQFLERLECMETAVGGHYRKVGENKKNIKELIKQLDKKCEEEKKRLGTQREQIKRLRTAIDSDLTQLDFFITHGTEIQQAIVIHTLNQNHPLYDFVIKEGEQDIKKVNTEYDVDERFQSFVEKWEPLEKISRTEAHPQLPAHGRKVYQLFHLDFKDNPCSTVQKVTEAIKFNDINVKTARDKHTCNINDIIQLRDGRILFVDYTNSKLKIANTNCVIQREITFESYPWSACCLSDAEVAVSIPALKTIKVVNINAWFRKVRNISTRYLCCGIAKIDGHLLVTTGSDEHFILVLDKLGVELRVFRPENYQAQQLLRPTFIKVNEANGTILISYELGHKIVAFDTNFQSQFEYMNEKCQYPTGSDLDRSGNVYVGGYISGNVQQITPNGKLLGTLIPKREGKRPLKVKILQNFDRFIVSYGNCNRVEIFDMRS